MILFLLKSLQQRDKRDQNIPGAPFYICELSYRLATNKTLLISQAEYVKTMKIGKKWNQNTRAYNQSHVSRINFVVFSALLRLLCATVSLLSVASPHTNNVIDFVDVLFF